LASRSRRVTRPWAPVPCIVAGSTPRAAANRRTAGDVMVPTATMPVAAPRENAASMLQRMEADALWHLPVVSDGRVIGVVSKDSLLRILARNLIPQKPAAPLSQP